MQYDVKKSPRSWRNPNGATMAIAVNIFAVLILAVLIAAAVRGCHICGDSERDGDHER